MNLKQVISITILIGIAVGFFTSFGQTYIPGTFNQLANSYAVWLTASFVGGYLLHSKKWALLSGVLIQLIAIAVYYFVSYLRFDMTFGSYGILLFWGIGGIVMGPLLGLAGYWWRYVENKKILATALLGSLYFSEGIRNLYEFGYSVGYVFIAIGVGILIAINNTKNDTLKSFFISIIIAAGMYVGLTYGFGFLYEILTGVPNE